MWNRFTNNGYRDGPAGKEDAPEATAALLERVEAETGYSGVSKLIALSLYVH